MQTIKDIQLQGKTVLLRVDFNIPMNKDGTIIDDSKMKAALPTIKYILDPGIQYFTSIHIDYGTHHFFSLHLSIS